MKDYLPLLNDLQNIIHEQIQEDTHYDSQREIERLRLIEYHRPAYLFPDCELAEEICDLTFYYDGEHAPDRGPCRCGFSHYLNGKVYHYVYPLTDVFGGYIGINKGDNPKIIVQQYLETRGIYGRMDLIEKIASYIITYCGRENLSFNTAPAPERVEDDRRKKFVPIQPITATKAKKKPSDPKSATKAEKPVAPVQDQPKPTPQPEPVAAPVVETLAPPVVQAFEPVEAVAPVPVHAAQNSVAERASSAEADNEDWKANYRQRHKERMEQQMVIENERKQKEAEMRKLQYEKEQMDIVKRFKQMAAGAMIYVKLIDSRTQKMYSVPAFEDTSVREIKMTLQHHGIIGNFDLELLGAAGVRRKLFSTETVGSAGLAQGLIWITEKPDF